jgi:hypothetical protein
MRLEVFVHTGCFSQKSALALAEELHRQFPQWTIQVIENHGQAEALGIVTLPAFVLDGQVIAVGVPRLEWLLEKLRNAPSAWTRHFPAHHDR